MHVWRVRWGVVQKFSPNNERHNSIQVAIPTKPCNLGIELLLVDDKSYTLHGESNCTNRFHLA